MEDTPEEHKSAAAGTIGAELQLIPEYDQCIVLLGSVQGMQTLLDSQPELAAAFPFDSAVTLEHSGDEELRERIDVQLSRGQARATEEAKEAALIVLGRSRNSPTFGSKNSILKLISQAKVCAYRRGETKEKGQQHLGPLLLPQDFDPNFHPGRSGLGSFQADERLQETGRELTAPSANGKSRPKPGPKNFDITFEHEPSITESNRKVFSDLVGCEALIRKFEGYSYLAMTVRDKNVQPHDRIPFCFVFKGPSGKLSSGFYHVVQKILTPG